jgi:hypothetical protein
MTKEKNCIIHSGKGMILPLSTKLSSIFGITVDDNHVSTKAKFPRRKYMGMCKLVSFQIRVIKPSFPTIVMRYITKNTRNKRIFPCG